MSRRNLPQQWGYDRCSNCGHKIKNKGSGKCTNCGRKYGRRQSSITIGDVADIKGGNEK
ncbi:MAG: hypothetical protein ACOC5T_06165 [Elusimicrobiota bacterium]